MKIPSFENIDLITERHLRQVESKTFKKWSSHLEEELDCSLASLDWMTPEGIKVHPLYLEENIKKLDHLNSFPGLAPFVRGPYPSM